MFHVQSLTQHGSPPPNTKLVIGPWADLPQANRQQLLWLLSHLPITLSITMAGAAMVSLVSHAGDARAPARTA